MGLLGSHHAFSHAKSWESWKWEQTGSDHQTLHPMQVHCLSFQLFRTWQESHQIVRQSLATPSKDGWERWEANMLFVMACHWRLQLGTNWIQAPDPPSHAGSLSGFSTVCNPVQANPNCPKLHHHPLLRWTRALGSHHACSHNQACEAATGSKLLTSTSPSHLTLLPGLAF
jgi:hypothetical protein